MSAITAQPSQLIPNATVRAGLALSAVIGLGNLPFLFLDIDWGAEKPPFALLLLNAAIGMVSVVCAIAAWNSGNRKAIRINAAALIINALMVLPGLFIDTSAFINDDKTIAGGDAEKGTEFFSSNCAMCHGDDGTALNFGNATEPDPNWHFTTAALGSLSSDVAVAITTTVGQGCTP